MTARSLNASFLLNDEDELEDDDDFDDDEDDRKERNGDGDEDENEDEEDDGEDDAEIWRVDRQQVESTFLRLTSVSESA